MSNETVVRTTISLPPAVLKKGQRAAKKSVRNFSSYIAQLIVKDSESPAPQTASAS